MFYACETEPDFKVFNNGGKIICVYNGETITKNFQVDLPDGSYKIRRYTVRECERLQTLPDGYLDGVISDSQAYKAIGNGWNVATVAHIFKAIPKQDIAKITVTSRCNWLLHLLRK